MSLINLQKPKTPIKSSFFYVLLFYQGCSSESPIYFSFFVLFWIFIYSAWTYFYIKFSSLYFRIFSLFILIFYFSYSLFVIYFENSFIIPIQLFSFSIPFFILAKLLKKEKNQKHKEYLKIFNENKNIRMDLRLAKNIQESLFPKLEPIHGLKYDVYRQIQNHIGGDFFDFIKLREGNVGIFMTDVAGHGVSSAMIAAMIKVLVSTMPYVYKQDPSALLSYLDKKMANDYKSEHATALYLFINFQTKTISLANAGHPYVIYQKKGEDFYEIETQGALLGYNIRSPIAINYSFSYSPGDRFIIYTDGLIEVWNPQGEYLGFENFLKILNQLKNEPTETFKEKLILEIFNFYKKTIFVDDVMFMIFELE